MEAFAGEWVNPGGRVANERPVAADNGTAAERVQLGRRENVAVEGRALPGDLFGFEKTVEMILHGARDAGSEAAADADGEMVVAWERPDVAREFGEEFDDHAVGGTRDEIADGELEILLPERRGAGQQRVAGAGGENHEIGARLAAGGGEA